MVADIDEPRSFIFQNMFGTRYGRNCNFLRKLASGTPEEVSAEVPVVNNATKTNVSTRMQDINVRNDKHNQDTQNKPDQDKCNKYA